MEQIIEIFHSYLDELYWIGFAIQLKKTEPDTYQWELAQFIETYG